VRTELHSCDTPHLLHDVLQHQCCTKSSGNPELRPHLVGHFAAAIARSVIGAMLDQPAIFQANLLRNALLRSLQLPYLNIASFPCNVPGKQQRCLILGMTQVPRLYSFQCIPKVFALSVTFSSEVKALLLALSALYITEPSNVMQHSWLLKH